jgi:hypothetical protein
MQVTFGTVSKKPNSTAQPSVTGRTLDVQIKDSSSILSPSIIVGVNDFDPSYNYAIIPKWNRRYFVSDSEVETGGRVTTTLTEDVLGTWKSQILASTQYVVRSASQFDPMISDGEFVITYDITQHTKNLTIPYPYLPYGSYILRCINDVTTPTTTGITSYILTAPQVRDVCREIAKVPKNLTDEGAKTLFKPFSYITSLMWLPIAPEALISTEGSGSSADTKYAVEIGYFEVKNEDGTKMYAPVINKDTGATVSIKNMEMPTNAYSDWRKYSDDYSAYNMYIPGVGTVNISASDTRNPLNLVGVVDGITGDVTWRLFSDGGTIATYNGSLGVNIQLGEFPPSKISYLSNQHITDLLDTKKHSGLAGGKTAFANLAALGMNKLTYDIRNIVDKDFSGSSGVKALGTVSVLGVSGNMATARAFDSVVITVKNFGTAEIPNSTAGRVLYSYRQLNTLSGFTVCSHSALSLSGAYDSETDAVKQTLDSGFYIE